MGAERLTAGAVRRHVNLRGKLSFFCTRGGEPLVVERCLRMGRASRDGDGSNSTVVAELLAV